MPRSAPQTEKYLSALAAPRREALSRVRDVINRNLPKGYEETVSGNYLMWQVPQKRYPDTYNGKPLMYLGLAAQKNFLTLYLLPAYGSPELLQRLRDGFAKAGKKLDMGKSCVHFKSGDDLELNVIGEIVAAVPVDRWVAIAQAARTGRKSKAPTSRKSRSRG